MKLSREEKRKKRHLRVRKKIKGTQERPRLVVYRSVKHFYASFVNDDETPCRVLTTVSTLSKEFREISEKENIKPWTKEAARIVGELAAKKAKELGIEKVVFDRAGYKYTGKVKEFAESARKGGLKF